MVSWQSVERRLRAPARKAGGEATARAAGGGAAAFDTMLDQQKVERLVVIDRFDPLLHERDLFLPLVLSA